MPAVPFIISFAVDSAIGAAVADAVGSEILGKAITSGISSGITSATQGGDPVAGAEKGFVSGGISGAITPAVTDISTDIGVPSEYAPSVAKGVASTASTLATGGTPKQALVGGLVTGGLDYAYGDTKGDPLASAEKAVIGKTLTDYFAPPPTRSAQTAGGGAAPEATSVTTTGAGQAPGSQALAQALRIGDAGSPIFGGDKDKEGGKQSGWNVESLRYMGQES